MVNSSSKHYSLHIVRFFQHFKYNYSNVMGKQGWNGIPNLVILLCPVASKEVVVWKSLQASSLSNRETPALRWIIMNVIVTILAYM